MSLVRRVESEIEAKLAPLGFVRVAAKPLKLVKTVNEQTEVFLFPGVMNLGRKIRIDPVVGVDNVRLRSRMLATNENWRNTHSVCHVYLGRLGSWNRFFLSDSSEIEMIAQEIADTTATTALPLLQQFDSFDTVRELFRADINRTGTQGLAVDFAQEKLLLMEDN